MQFTDTRKQIRANMERGRLIAKSPYGIVRLDTSFDCGLVDGENQTITSVRTRGTSDPNWSTYSKALRDKIRASRRYERRLRRLNRKTNPNPCIISKSMCKSEGVVRNNAWNPGNTYQRYYELYCNPAKYALNLYQGSEALFPEMSTQEKRFYENAIIKAYAKANSPSMPGLVYLGELGETLAMLRNPLSGLRKLGKSMRSRARTRLRKKVISYADGIANQWLEYRYGIVPLMAQVDEICEAVANRLLLGYPIKLTRDGLKQVVNDKYTTKLNHRVCPSYLYGHSYVYEYEEIGAYATLAHQLQVDEAKFFGFRPRDVLPAVWELVPYSFVVDWVFNVGDWLQAIQPNPALNVKSISISVKRKKVVKYSTYAIGFESTVAYAHPITASCERTVERLDRVVNLSVPALPVFNPNFLKYQRVLDSVALSYGQLKRTFRALR